MKWHCKRCKIDVKEGRCECKSSPSPWIPVYESDDDFIEYMESLLIRQRENLKIMDKDTLCLSTDTFQKLQEEQRGFCEGMTLVIECFKRYKNNE